MTSLQPKPFKIHLYRGSHSTKLLELLRHNWNTNQLTILVPPHLQEFSFLKGLTNSDAAVEFHGEWDSKQAAELQKLIQIKSDIQDISAKLDKAVLAVFTSGTTTGRPRLVFYSKDNIIFSLDAIRKLFDVQKMKSIFVYPQPTHCFGLLLGYMQSIIYGNKLFFHEGAYTKNAHQTWVNVNSNEMLTLGAPVHFSDLIDYTESKSIAVKESYSAIVGGARVTKKLWHQLRDKLKITNPSVGYGATEASPGITHLPPGVEPVVDGDIGFALDGVTLSNSEGGIEFQGKNVCLGIYENFQLKQDDKILIKDFISVEESDSSKPRYTFICRTDLLINRGGLKVSLEALESQIASELRCKCVAIAVYNERLGQDIAVVIEIKDNEVSKESVQDLSKLLFGFKLAAENIVFDKIPLNSNHKFDRKESLKLFFKTLNLKFPVSIELLKPFLLHTGPAVWIDDITETRKNFGKAQVRLKANGNYFINSKLTESSMIELMAQTYGYSLAVNDILEIQRTVQAKTTLIAEIKDSHFDLGSLNKQAGPGDVLVIETQCTHDFGTLKVVEGKITLQDKIIAKLNMKLYCN